MSLSEKKIDPEILDAVMNRLHRRWRLIISMPFLYLILGFFIWRFYFLPSRDGQGFWAMSEFFTYLFLIMGGMLGLFLWVALNRLRVRETIIFLSPRFQKEDPFETAKSLQLLQFALCDLATFPGIILFLLLGEPYYLVAFVIFSSFLYLQALPQRPLIEELLSATGHDK